MLPDTLIHCQGCLAIVFSWFLFEGFVCDCFLMYVKSMFRGVFMDIVSFSMAGSIRDWWHRRILFFMTYFNLILGVTFKIISYILYLCSLYLYNLFLSVTLIVNYNHNVLKVLQLLPKSYNFHIDRQKNILKNKS